MYFGLSEEQELLQETVRGYVAGECPPEKMRRLFDEGSGFDPGLWQGLGEIGIGGLAVPEALGGAGMEWLELALVCEVLGGGSVPTPLLGHALACRAITVGGSPAQQQRWLPGLASGERIGAIALAEDDDRWEAEAWSTPLEGGRLSGRKRYATDVETASLFVVGVAGGGLAVVERQAPGVKVERVPSIDHSRQVGDLLLEGAAAEPLADTGAAVAHSVRDAGLVLLAADAFGAAQRLVALSTAYAGQRRQFGQEIAQFQAVKHQLADMATEIECARGLFWYASHAVDHLPGEAMRQSALAKAHITDVAARIARDAVELHGGLGFTWDCDVHIHLKRVMFDRAFLGTPEQHRRRIAAQEGW